MRFLGYWVDINKYNSYGNFYYTCVYRSGEKFYKKTNRMNAKFIEDGIDVLTISDNDEDKKRYAWNPRSLLRIYKDYNEQSKAAYNVIYSEMDEAIKEISEYVFKDSL